MIRREIQFPNQPPQWLLISQLEHARISGLLAERCLPHLDQRLQAELLQAIIHHDDGWAAWESQPQLDPVYHCPLSFRELPLEMSLPISTASINAAAEIGPLAAWVVVGHFLALLKAKDKPIASSPAAVTWQAEMIARQSEWFGVWQSLNAELHTQALADEALLWLQLFDVMSLWLCSVCPGRNEQVSEAPESYHVGVSQPLETEFSYESVQVRIKPWRFDVPNMQLEAAGWVVPIREYSNANELFSARVDYSIQWHLSEK